MQRNKKNKITYQAQKLFSARLQSRLHVLSDKKRIFGIYILKIVMNTIMLLFGASISPNAKPLRPLLMLFTP